MKFPTGAIYLKIAMKFNKLLPFVFIFLGMAIASADEIWMTDFKAALDKAKSKEKPLLVDFTGSDWCGWCIKLDNEVFSKDAFKKFAKAELVLVEIDFPNRKKQSEALKGQNEKLAQKYGIRGFPTILLLSPDGEVIAKTGYQAGGPEAYVQHLKDLLGE